MEPRLSQYGAASRVPAPVNAMMADFAEVFRDGVDINLGVGYVNERTIPEALMQEALDAVLTQRARYRQAFNYGGPQGSRNLIESIRRFLEFQRVGGLDAAALAGKQIAVGASGATSILDALADVFAPGIVVTADPMYYIYCNALERKGFRVVTVPEEQDGVDPARLRARIEGLGGEARGLAFLYFVTVNNPSCTILSNDKKHAIVELAARLSREQGRQIPVFFDQAYELLIHDPAVPPVESAMLHDAEGVAYEIGTLSKILAPALRAGYLCGPPGALMDAVVQKTSDVGFSAPLFAQEMASYLLDHHVAAQIERVNAGYREKSVQVHEAIVRRLGPWVERLRGGSAGFYYYLTLASCETAPGCRFFQTLARNTGDPALDGPPNAPYPRVIYIPGVYCVHPKGEQVDVGRRELRLSYGFEEPDAIVRALDLMAEAVAAVS